MTGVSYVVTVYNKAPYIKDVFEAFEKQQGGFQKEYIFVDDGSTDESLSILFELERKSDKVKIISQENKGPSIATNIGLSQAKFEYVKLVDGDDIMMPGGTESMLEAIHNKKHDVAIGKSGRYRSVQGKIEFKESEEKSLPFLLSNSLKKTIKNAFFTPTHMLVKNSLIQELGGCDERVFIQDYSIVLRLANKGPFVCVKDTVFCAPEDAPGRMSANVAQTLHDLNVALYYFFKENTLTDKSLLSYAAQKATGRSWKWARRNSNDLNDACKYFMRYAVSKAPVGDEIKLDLIGKSCEIFKKTNKIRKPFCNELTK